MPIPTNKKLYEEVKAEIYTKCLAHSAYCSGLLVHFMKREVEHAKEKRILRKV